MFKGAIMYISKRQQILHKISTLLKKLAMEGEPGQPCPKCGSNTIQKDLAFSTYDHCPKCDGGKPLILSVEDLKEKIDSEFMIGFDMCKDLLKQCFSKALFDGWRYSIVDDDDKKLTIQATKGKFTFELWAQSPNGKVYQIETYLTMPKDQDISVGGVVLDTSDDDEKSYTKRFGNLQNGVLAYAYDEYSKAIQQINDLGD